jgi:hypothetical protein
VLACVLALNIDRSAMHLGRFGVRSGLFKVHALKFRIGSPLSFAFRLTPARLSV